MFQENVVEKIKTHIMAITFLDNYAVMRKCEKILPSGTGHR